MVSSLPEMAVTLPWALLAPIEVEHAATAPCRDRHRGAFLLRGFILSKEDRGSEDGGQSGTERETCKARGEAY